MKRFTFKKIDAFATELSSGNPAGAIYLKDHEEITAQEMQRIATELKGFVSEVGYAKRRDEATFDLRYYSSEREVDFCGHATVAIMYDLIRNSRTLMDIPVITISTNKGRLLVENRVRKDDAVFISAPAPVFSESKLQKKQIALSLGIHPDDISTNYPVAVINAGLETLIVPIKTLDAVLSMRPGIETAKGFCQKNGIDIITVFTEETSDNIHSYRTRVFAHIFGYLEDPATGSGNAALGSYLLEDDRWDGTCISLEQNAEMHMPNIVRIEARHEPDRKPCVLFGGSAVARIKGEYILA